MYLAVISISVLAYLMKSKVKKINHLIFVFLFLTLYLMLSLRYGQGTDYFSYSIIFHSFSDLKDAFLNPHNIHSEIGFRILCALFNDNYELFIFTISSFEMIMLLRFIKKYSKNEMLSLVLCYPTIYLSYFFSMLRQGIVIAVFIGFMFELLEKKRWVIYYILCFFAITIHMSALILFVIPLLYKVKLEKMFILTFISFCIGIFLCTPTSLTLFSKLPIIGPHIALYLNTSPSFFALLERLISCLCVLLLYFYNQKSIKKDKHIDILLKIYFGGMSIYLLAFGFRLISSRLMIYAKAMEIIIFPYLLELKSKYRQLVIAFLLTSSFFMTCKNISSYLDQGMYKENISFMEYPYVSIFNKDNLWKYKNHMNIYHMYE